MSKNITIQEGGIAKQMTVNKLKTNLVGGGTCLWVPEDGTILGTKFISENGTYRASDDGYYGYLEVTVNGQGVVSGKDPDGSGDEAVAEVDPSTGEITITKIPSRIEVVTPPTNPYGIYTDGQSISTNSMVVKAYLESGAEYGTVPINEITINPTVAVYDAATDRPSIDVPEYAETGTITVTGGIPLSSIIDYVIGGVILADIGAPDPNDTYTKNPPTYVGDTSLLSGIGYMGQAARNLTTDYYSGTLSHFFALDDSINNKTINIPSSQKAIAQVSITFRTNRTQRSIGIGKYVWDYTLDTTVNIEPYTSTFTVGFIGQKTLDNDRYQICGINGTAGRPGSHQTINVSWPRPGDGKVLETTFEILVAPGYGGDEGENGNAGTPPPGMLIP